MSEGRETTRQRMLDAGVDLWSTEEVAELFAGLSVARIAREAGVTRSTFYAYWSSTDEYLLDLTRHLSVPGRGLDPQPAGPGAAALTLAGRNLVAQFLAACDGYMLALVNDPRLRLRFGLLSKVDDAEIAEQLRHVLHETEAIRSKVFSRQLPVWGRWTRSPMETHHLHAIFTAMAEGLALRHILEPDRYPVTLYGLSALSLMLVLTARKPNDRSVYAVLEVANDWAGTALERAERPTPASGEPLSADDIRHIVVEARRFASASGWESVTISGVALLAAVPESRVLEAFGSKAGLAMGIHLFNLSERYRDLEQTDDALADLRRMLAVTAEELRRSPVFSQAMVSIIAGQTGFAPPQSFPFDTHPQIEEAVRRAQEQGRLDRGLPARELAATLGRTVLVANLPLTRPLTPTIDAVELVLRGAGAAPPEDDGTTPLA